MKRGHPGSCERIRWFLLSSATKRASRISRASIRPCSKGTRASPRLCTRGASLVCLMSAPLAAQAMKAQPMKPKVFVLVHPAWHGGWVWTKVVPLLRQKGHLVFTPTLTGLGERSHLARPDIGLDVHVTDVINVLKYEDLHDVVLVGHSSSGAVITGVADRAPTPIALVVYLDAFVPEDGQAVLDLITPERRQM